MAGRGSSGGTCARRAAAWLASVVCIAATLAVALGPLARVARADGDPASDYLLSSQVFLGAQPPAPTAQTRALQALVTQAGRRGVHLRVALIPSAYDLGAITQLWGRPQLYARFLGLELSGAYSGRLLVVMPAGLGLADVRRGTVSSESLPAGLSVGTGPSGLVASAQRAVRAVAQTQGVTLPVGGSPPAGGGLIWLWVLVGVAVLAGAVALVRAHPRGRGETARGATARGATARGATAEGARRRLAPRPLALGLAALLAVAIAVPVGIVALVRGSPSASEASAAIVTPPALSWPAGRRPAPDFALADESGHRVSVSAFRGRPVIVTFVDPLCRNLCPLEAHLLNYVVGQMPAARRPAILAVSVDLAADSPADLRLDNRRWSLVPQWHWAVGSPSALAAVWRRYAIGVSVVTKHVGSLALRYITHSEAAYILDATGHERALFLWPFYPQDVARVLDELRAGG